MILNLAITKRIMDEIIKYLDILNAKNTSFCLRFSDFQAHQITINIFLFLEWFISFLKFSNHKLILPATCPNQNFVENFLCQLYIGGVFYS